MYTEEGKLMTDRAWTETVESFKNAGIDGLYDPTLAKAVNSREPEPNQ